MPDRVRHDVLSLFSSQVNKTNGTSDSHIFGFGVLDINGGNGEQRNCQKEQGAAVLNHLPRTLHGNGQCLSASFR